MSRLLVTFHIQKDGRISLGTVAHRTKDCPALRDREVYEIGGEVASMIPVCKKCGFSLATGWTQQKVADA